MIALVCCSLSLADATWAQSDEQAIDASDPTRIYTYAGGGLKYNEYTNSDHMIEFRAIGNIGLGEDDTILFEGGYGWHRDLFLEDGDESDWTNFRFRWFHLFDMNYDLGRGYRGWGTQVDVQLAGQLPGTDGQNQVAIGVMPVFALGGDWNLYLQLNVVSAWDKKWKNYNGTGPGVNAQFVYSPTNWWPGAQMQIIPQYTYFVTSDLKADGSGTLEINVGGQITSTIMWDITGQKFYDLDLKSLRSDVLDPELKNDWNVFLNVTTYF